MKSLILKGLAAIAVAGTFVFTACKDSKSDSTNPTTPSLTVKDGRIAHNWQPATFNASGNKVSNSGSVTRWDADSTSGRVTAELVADTIEVRGYKGNPLSAGSQFIFLAFKAANGSYPVLQTPTNARGAFAFFGSNTAFGQFITDDQYAIKGNITVSNFNATAKTFDLTYNFDQYIPSAAGTNVSVTSGAAKKITYR